MNTTTNNTSRPYILYLEDDYLETMRFTMALQHRDFNGKIEIAMNGQEGIDILNQKRHHLPDIIIVDLNMPVMNGFEFMEFIKNDITLRRIPVIVLTTSSNESDIVKSYDFQVAGYFTKPFGAEEYNRIIACIKEYWDIARISKS